MPKSCHKCFKANMCKLVFLLMDIKKRNDFYEIFNAVFLALNKDASISMTIYTKDKNIKN